jgi:AraC-like DNA-binding protein
MSTSITKDALVDLTLELLVRIIQTQTAKSIDDGLFADPNTPISQVLDYIRVNLRENITLKNLSEKACMSTTSFFGFSKENWA